MTNTNKTFNLSSDALALVEVLLKALFEANRLDGTMAYQQHAFGKIADALVETLACAIADSEVIFFGDARDIALRIYTEALDNGENIAYQIDLHNKGEYSINFRSA